MYEVCTLAMPGAQKKGMKEGYFSYHEYCFVTQAAMHNG